MQENQAANREIYHEICGPQGVYAEVAALKLVAHAAGNAAASACDDAGSAMSQSAESKKVRFWWEELNPGLWQAVCWVATTAARVTFTSTTIDTPSSHTHTSLHTHSCCTLALSCAGERGCGD